MVNKLHKTIECGGLDSRVKDLGPFFCLVRSGGMSVKRELGKNSKSGIFAFSNTKSGGYLFKTGLIMPVDLINSSIKDELQIMLDFISTLPMQKEMSHSRIMLQEYLNNHNLEFLKIKVESELDGWIEFTFDKKTFDLFIKNLSYVSKVQDNGINLSIRESKEFRWKSYGELLEWFYGFPERNNRSKLEPFSFYLVHQYISGAGYSVLSKPRINSDYEYPKIDLTVLFDLKKDIQNSTIEVFIDKTQSGWSCLRMTIDTIEYPVILSNAFDPINEIVSFIRAVDRGDFPIVIAIDEEGSDKKIEGYGLSESGKFLLVISELYDEDNTPIIQAVFEKEIFVKSMVKAFKDFFEYRYDHKEWECEWNTVEDMPVKESILNDSWFCEKLEQYGE